MNEMMHGLLDFLEPEDIEKLLDALEDGEPDRFEAVLDMVFTTSLVITISLH